MPTLNQIGEHAAIEALTRSLPLTGDDCALVALDDSPYDLVLTSDPLIEEVHFVRGTAPERIGWKATARVLSDLAAMGAEPQWLLVNLVCPGGTELEQLEKIYKGIHELIDRFDVHLAGGDLAQGPVLELHLFGTGRVPKGTALLRSGARPGDALYVTGPLGGSLESGHHLDFMPRVTAGQRLRESGLVHAMMDLSDGLGTDLRHLLRASGVGADLASGKIPANGTLEQALYDGEDFELLLAVPPHHTAALESLLRKEPDLLPARIGTCTANANHLTLDGIAVEGKAFEHFKK